MITIMTQAHLLLSQRSIIFGTVVFLRSEQLIRNAVNKVLNSTLLLIEAEVRSFFSREASINQSQWRQLERLSALHSKLATTGSYRSALASGISILAPLTPIASFVGSLLVRGSGH
jgi:hypothetical protein